MLSITTRPAIRVYLCLTGLIVSTVLPASPVRADEVTYHRHHPAHHDPYYAAYRERFDALRRLARDGDLDAQYRLGQQFERGDAVRRDPSRAYVWYRVAALRGHPAAAQAGERLENWLSPRQLDRGRHRARLLLRQNRGRWRDDHAAAGYRGGFYPPDIDPGEIYPRDGYSGDGYPRDDRSSDYSDNVEPRGPWTAPGENNRYRHELDRQSIRLIQRALRALGYRPGPVDGVFGRHTRTAIARYQHDHRLPVDGRPTLDLMDHLRTALQTELDGEDQRYSVAR